MKTIDKINNKEIRDNFSKCLEKTIQQLDGYTDINEAFFANIIFENIFNIYNRKEEYRVLFAVICNAIAEELYFED